MRKDWLAAVLVLAIAAGGGYFIYAHNTGVIPVQPPVQTLKCVQTSCNVFIPECGFREHAPNCLAVSYPQGVCWKFVGCAESGGKCEMVKQPEYGECTKCFRGCRGVSKAVEDCIKTCTERFSEEKA